MSFGLGISFGRLCRRARTVGWNPGDTIQWETEHFVFSYTAEVGIQKHEKELIMQCDYITIPGTNVLLLKQGNAEPFTLSNKWIDPK